MNQGIKMSIIFEQIKKESLTDGGSEELLDGSEYYVERALNYWITLNQALPEDSEIVLAIGCRSFSENITIEIVKFNKDGNYFSDGDNEFRAFGWRPLPKINISSLL